MSKRLSFRIRDELATRIAAGSIAPGAKLPSEPVLAIELGVSRATLREALRSLEEDGFVTRTRGSGTHATYRPRLRNNLDMNFGVTDAIAASGMTPGTRDSAVRSAAATTAEREALGLAQDAPVVILERVRTADGRAVVSSRDVLSADTISLGELAGMSIDGSVYAVLEGMGRPVARGVVTISPMKTDRAMARRLDVKVGVLLLHLRQVDYGSDGAPLLLSDEFHLAEAFEFTVVRRGPGKERT